MRESREPLPQVGGPWWQARRGSVRQAVRYPRPLRGLHRGPRRRSPDLPEQPRASGWLPRKLVTACQRRPQPSGTGCRLRNIPCRTPRPRRRLYRYRRRFLSRRTTRGSPPFPAARRGRRPAAVGGPSSEARSPFACLPPEAAALPWHCSSMVTGESPLNHPARQPAQASRLRQILRPQRQIPVRQRRQARP